MKDSLFLIFIYPLLVSIILPVDCQAQTVMNPVVIQYGDKQMDRREFELEFEMVMVLKAVESGVPVKSQDQIVLMQRRYLEQRAKEMVLLDVAVQRGIRVSDEDLRDILDGYMKTLGFSGFNMRNVNKLGLTDDTRLRAYLRRREMLTKLMADINTDLQVNDKGRALKAAIDRYYTDSGVRIFPEYLQRPLGE